jgi:hypothetical protein
MEQLFSEKNNNLSQVNWIRGGCNADQRPGIGKFTRIIEKI